jgi:hypothetical protein
MSDNERAELGERVAVLEALFKQHEEGAATRKAELSKQLDGITDKLNAQQCAVHTVNMLAMQGQITGIKEKEIPRLDKRIDDVDLKAGSRLSFLEKCFWVASGGFAVIVALLKWVIK